MRKKNKTSENTLIKTKNPIKSNKKRIEPKYPLIEKLDKILVEQRIEPYIKKLREKVCDILFEKIEKLPLTELGKGVWRQEILVTFYDAWNEDENGNLTYGLITEKQLKKYMREFQVKIRESYVNALETMLDKLNEQGLKYKFEWLIEQRNKAKKLLHRIKFISPEKELSLLELHIGMLESEIEIIEYRKAISLHKDEKKIKQRDEIRNYLKEEKITIDSMVTLNIKDLAREITTNYYPSLKGTYREKKIESIRQELMLVKNGKIPI